MEKVQSPTVAVVREPNEVESLKTQLGEVLSTLAKLTSKVAEMGGRLVAMQEGDGHGVVLQHLSIFGADSIPTKA